MSLNKSCSRVHICKNLFDPCPIQNDQKQGDAFSTLPFNLTLEYVSILGRNINAIKNRSSIKGY